MADLRGGAPGARPPPTDRNFFNFMGFFTKYIKYNGSAPPPKGLAPSPTTSPGSAPEYCEFFKRNSRQENENYILGMLIKYTKKVHFLTNMHVCKSRSTLTRPRLPMTWSQ